MANEVTTSKQFSINWRDIAKGVLVSAVSAVLTAIYAALTVVPFSIDFKQMAIVGLTAGLAYLLKNFVTPTQTVITGTPQPSPKAISEMEDGDGSGTEIPTHKPPPQP